MFRDSRAVNLEEAVEQDAAAAAPQDSDRRRNPAVDYRPVRDAMRLTDAQKCAILFVPGSVCIIGLGISSSSGTCCLLSLCCTHALDS